MAVCDLCPFNCDIPEGQNGKCKVRGNRGDFILLLTYGQVTTMIDGPIEQKPLYHYHPGMKVLSIGSSGCNMFCGYCQNFEISQVGDAASKTFDPIEIVEKAKQLGCGGIAFTYSEPLVWYEYIFNVAICAKKSGLKTILKTNAYCNHEKFKELLGWIDAINIDVKGSAKLYKDVAGIDLPENPALWSIMRNVEHAARKCHLEISTIAIPPYCNDEEERDILFQDLFRVCGPTLPLHILRFIPDYKMRNNRAPTMDELNEVADNAREYFDYVYIDFAGLPVNTICDCGVTLVERDGILVKSNNLVRGKLCPGCMKVHYFES